MDTSQHKRRILITGATGYIGRRLAFRLLESKAYRLRLFVRNAARVQAALASEVEIACGSTFDQESLSGAVEGVDTAFYLIHSMTEKDDYGRLDRLSAENFRRACISAGVRRIVYLGGLGEKESASKHLHSRMETGEILASEPDRIQTIFLRAGVIIGSGSASFEIIRNLTQKLPVMITPKWVRTRTQPIGIHDVLSYLEQSITLETAETLEVDIGADILSFQEMMEQTAQAFGLKRSLVPVPFFSPKLSSYWLVLFTPIPFGVASALVEGLKSETVVQNENAARYYPQITPEPFLEAVKRAKRQLENDTVISRWCDSGGEDVCDIKQFDTPGSGVFRDTRTVAYEHGELQAEVFQSACRLGGSAGWYRYTFLWILRGLIDKLAGGYGLNRGRRTRSDLRVGDAVDFWKVADIKEGKRVLFYAEMKLPGKAWLEFDVQPEQLVQTAHFIPRGLSGRLYWYAVLPFHYFVFTDLCRQVVKHSRETPE